MLGSQMHFTWTAQQRRQALLLALLGQTPDAIADQIGCTASCVQAYLGEVSDLPQLALSDVLNLFERVDVERNMLELMQARSGTPEQARLRSSLLAKSKLHLVPQEVDMDNTTPALKTLSQLGAMSADELRDHVAGLVPGLEHKNRILRRRDRHAQDSPLSGDRAQGSVSAKR